MFKWTMRSEVKARCSRPSIWAQWSQVSQWPNWDEALEWSRLEGPFAVGTKGQLKPQGWSPLSFTLTQVDEEGFSDQTQLPFTKIVFSHRLTGRDGNLTVIHSVQVKGLLAPLLFWTMGRKLKKELPKAVTKLVQLGELQ